MADLEIASAALRHAITGAALCVDTDAATAQILPPCDRSRVNATTLSSAAAALEAQMLALNVTFTQSAAALEVRNVTSLVALKLQT